MRKLLLILILLSAFGKSISQDSTAIKRTDSIVGVIDAYKNISVTIACGEVRNLEDNSIGSFSEEITSDPLKKELLKVNNWEEWNSYTTETNFYFHQEKLIKITASIYMKDKLQTYGSYYYKDGKSFYDRVEIKTSPAVEIRIGQFLKLASDYLSDYQKSLK